MIIDAHLHLPPAVAGRTLADSRARLLAELARVGVDHAVVIADNVHGSIIGDTDSRQEKYGTSPPACGRMNRMRG